MSHPWLSVLMPTCNGSTYLTAALESILRQGDTDIEVIAVDDGSTDNTIQILEFYASRLHLKIIQRDHIGNWVANTNYALANANADYVCLLHQDDLWLPHRLGALKRFLRMTPEATLFLHPVWFIGAHGGCLGAWRCPLASARPLPSPLVVERLLVQDFIATPAPLFRRDVALDVGGLDSSLWYAADWDFWLKLAATGTTVYWPRPLAEFRIHPLSQTVVRSVHSDDVRQQLSLVFEKHFAMWADRLPASETVRQVGDFTRELNVHLFAFLHGHRVCWPNLIWHFISLGTSAWPRFFRDSRIIERILARIRGGLLHSPPVPPPHNQSLADRLAEQSTTRPGDSSG